jgi:hypothetical protein
VSALLWDGRRRRGAEGGAADYITAPRAKTLLYQRMFSLVEELPGDTWGTRVTERRFELRFEASSVTSRSPPDPGVPR